MSAVDDVLAEAERLKREARQNPEIVEAANRQRLQWARERLGDGATDAEIEAKAATLESRTLPPDFELMTEHGETLTVADLVANPQKYNGIRLSDPLEPDYRGDNRIAVFLYDQARDTGQIYSHAHGGVRYDLGLSFAVRAFADLPDSELEPKTPFTLTSLADFVRRGAPDYLVKGLIPRAVLGSIFGAPGAGKSFLALDLAACVARGVPWRDRRVKQGPVCYVVAEGVGGFVSRVAAYLLHHRLEPEDVPISLIVDRVPRLTEDHDAGGLIDSLRSLKPSMVVIDTLAAVTPGANENAGEDMGAVLFRCQRITQATGAAVLLIHHSGKDASRGQRGWSGLKGGADVEIEVSRLADARIAKVTKSKDGVDGGEFAFKLESVWLGIDEDGDDLNSCVVTHQTASPAKSFRPQGKWQAAVFNAAGLSFDEWTPIEQVITDAMTAEEPPAGKDRRREYAARSLENLIEAGALVKDGDRIRKSA